MSTIHSTAIVSDRAQIGENVIVGPYTIVEDDVKIGSGTTIESHAVIKRYTQLGEHNHIHAGVVLGDIPQNVKYEEVKSYLIIGNNNIFREHSTLHRSTFEDQATTVGDHNYFMGCSHAGHDCQIGNHVIIANCALLAGHTQVDDRAFISGGVAIHQFTHIGELAMIGGVSAVSNDVPPYVMAVGRPASATGLNIVGLRRAGFDQETRQKLKEAFKLFYTSDLNTSQAIAAIEADDPTPAVKQFVDFIKNSKRGITRHANLSAMKSTL